MEELIKRLQTVDCKLMMQTEFHLKSIETIYRLSFFPDTFVVLTLCIWEVEL